MEKRYNALRAIGTIFKILGVIFGVITILLMIAACATSVLGGAAVEQFGQEFGSDFGIGIFGGIIGGIIASLFVIFSVGVPALTFYGFGELLFLFLAMEENTRAAAFQLQNKPQPLEPPAV